MRAFWCFLFCWRLLVAVAEVPSFLLRADKIDLYFQRAALMAILKAKARRLVTFVDKADEVVYFQCANEARTPVMLAQCVVSLMKARDSKAERQIGDPWDTDWFRELKKLFWPSAERKRPLGVPKASRLPNPIIEPNKQSMIAELRNELHRLVTGNSKTKRKSLNVAIREELQPMSDPPEPQILPRPTTEIPPNIQPEPPTPLEAPPEAPPEEEELVPFERPFEEMEIRSSQRLTVVPSNPQKLETFLRRKDLFSRRAKRSSALFKDSALLKDSSALRDQFPNIQNLRRIDEFFSKSAHCSQYFHRLKVSNDQFLQRYEPEYRYNVRKEDFVDSLVRQLDSLLAGSRFDRFSIMSPRILSVFPNSNKKKGFLSPSLLNFHDDGPLSLPRLLKLASSDDGEVLRWTELLMDLSGAGRQLRTFLNNSESDIRRMETEIYPRVKEMEEKEKRWRSVLNDRTPKQNRELQQHGYSFLERRQTDRVIDDLGDVPDYVFLSSEQREKRLEERIREIAQINETELMTKQRKKRQAEGPGNTSSGLKVLRPFVFSNFLNEHSVFEGLILSPHAFVTEVLRYEIMTTDILSPRAFIATILSPQALVSRVLAPAAFRAEVLSPNILFAFVLSPEALISYILTPRIVETRIASPEALTLLVLSPGIVAPRIGSGEHYAVMVLSPNILSPRYNSTEQMVVEILSPHILGGSHETEDEQNANRIVDLDAGREVHFPHIHGNNADGGHIDTGVQSFVGANPFK